MARKSLAKSTQIDPVKVCTLALKQVRCAADYHRIGNANSPEIVTAAWEQLTIDEQQRITDLINSNVQPDPQVLANELIACGVALELKRIKAEYGDVAVKAAWKLLPPSERDGREANRLRHRIKAGQTHLILKKFSIGIKLQSVL